MNQNNTFHEILVVATKGDTRPDMRESAVRFNTYEDEIYMDYQNLYNVFLLNPEPAYCNYPEEHTF